jgi:hypothetical protein
VEHAEALIITGVYGTGKSSMAEEIADILEKQGAPYAVLDLDWLGWFAAADADAHRRVLLANLGAVAGNFREAGVRLLVLAYSVSGAAELSELRATLGIPVKVVRLTLPLAEITRRLASSVTAGRQDDLREAATWLAEGRGAGIEDLAMANDRPIREVATDIVAWLGWP